MNIIYIAIILFMILWIQRNNKKDKQKAEQIINSLKPGMYVMLKDGIFGTIVDLDGDNVVINISVEGTDEGCITVAKANVYGEVSDTGERIEAGTEKTTEGMSIEEKIKRVEMLNAEDEEEPEADTKELEAVETSEPEIEITECSVEETPENVADSETEANTSET